jgi:hypothetical protein
VPEGAKSHELEIPMHAAVIFTVGLINSFIAFGAVAEEASQPKWPDSSGKSSQTISTPAEVIEKLDNFHNFIKDADPKERRKFELAKPKSEESLIVK